MVVVVAVGRDAEFPGRLIWPWKSSFPLWKWSRASIQGPHLRLPPPSLYARGGRREEASYLFSRRILSSCWSPLHNKKILFFLFNYRTASWIHFHLFIFYRFSFFLSYLSTRRQNFMAIWNGSNFTLRLPASFCVTFDWLALKCLSLNLLGRATISIPSLKNGSTLSSSGRSSCVGRTTTSVEIGSHLMCLTVCWKKALVVFRLSRGGGWHTRCFKYVRCSKHVTTSLKTVVGGC